MGDRSWILMVSGYKPLKITGNSTGLVQQREEFLLPNDAYPTLLNAYCWRERILRKKGYELLGRLQRNFTTLNFLPTNAAVNSTVVFNALTITGFIVAANNANPGQVTTSAPHNLVTGNTVIITGVVGATGYNNVPFTITFVDALNFTIGTNAGGFGEYVSGGTFVSNRRLSNTEPNAAIVPGSVVYTVMGSPNVTYTDDGQGGLTASVGGTSGLILYNIGTIDIVTPPFANGSASILTYSYYPNLPVMGIRVKENQNSANDLTIFFDQKYAYNFNGGTNLFQEFIPGTVWNLHNGDTTATDFFWSTNYWVSASLISGTATPFFTTNNIKLFWETNNTGQFGSLADPPRITDGTTWYPFYNDANTALTPWAQIDSTNFLVNYLCNLPFRGRMVVFNTWEGVNATSAQNFSNRIRWSTIGNPFIPYAAGPPSTGSWRDDIRGQGGFLDIPTSEDIVAVGFVRDNLVIYCERTTWQLRYTGRTIAPFQIERVNSELGTASTFGAIQFDTSLLGVGDKGIVECDSYRSNRIDIKIVDFVFQITSDNFGPVRIQGIRDFENRLAYWTIPLQNFYDPKIARVYPNVRLVYNYENDSWSIFNDSLTALGTYQNQSSRTWLNTHLPWKSCKFSWIGKTVAEIPSILGGNQQGFIEYLDEADTNDVSLYIDDIIANQTFIDPFIPDIAMSSIFICPNHNMKTGMIIETSGFVGFYAGPPLQFNLNGIFGISVIDNNTFSISVYDPASGQFSTPFGARYLTNITNITNANPAVVTYSGGTVLNSGVLITINNVVGMTQLNGGTYSVTDVSFNMVSLNGVDSTLFGDYVSGGTIQVPYPGGALIAIRENFSINSKKFNFLDEGQNIQLGYIDILMEATGADNPGEISMNIYNDYDNINSTNIAPENAQSDTFFNSVIPTIPSTLNGTKGTKFWQRVICPTRANFLTIEYTFSNLQMSSTPQELPVQIDAQVIWIRKGGRMTQP
jgi:hypothetical protein